MVWSISGAAQAVASSGECTREHRGDLVLSGDQILVISNETFCLHGNIEVRGNARLVILDSTLRMGSFSPGIWQPTVRFRVFDSASLEVRRVTMEPVTASSTGGIWINSYGSARVVLDHVVPENGVWIVPVARDSSRMEILGCTLMELRVADRAHVVIQGTEVEWAVDLEYASIANVELDGLIPGEYSYWESPSTVPACFYLRLE
ncbi:MAG: hypothetical protein ABID40_04850 [Candidatus Bipolaricaulota bacterium]